MRKIWNNNHTKLPRIKLDNRNACILQIAHQKVIDDLLFEIAKYDIPIMERKLKLITKYFYYEKNG